MDYRIEKDSLGEVKVPSDKLWGAQTERSRNNFKIGVGIEVMPVEIIRAFGYLKKACAIANANLIPLKMTEEKKNAIVNACDKIISGEYDGEFPLVVFQTGSGTQSNMNANEVIANSVNISVGKKLCHPNDDVNMSQSSNDTFPSATSIAAVISLKNDLIPAIDKLIDTLIKLEKENENVVKTGRTHLQDAVPIAFSQEISGWRVMMTKSKEQIVDAVKYLTELAIGGTAVGTGLNAPESFGDKVAEVLSELTGIKFTSEENKFHALTGKDAIVFAHGAIKGLAANLMKIANDIRWLSSGPRCGLNEIIIPENEPGSSIMPGKVNPTQCEAITQIAVQVMGNDAAIGFAASQGNFELNVFMPVIAYNFLQSVRLLADGIKSFNDNCVSGIKANKDKMKGNLYNSLMLITALSPEIGYENAALVAKKAYSENLSLKAACLSLGLMTEAKFDELFKPENMAYPHK